MCLWLHVLFTHLPSVIGKFLSRQPKPVLNREKFTNGQTVKNARNSNFSSSNCWGPNLLTMTKTRLLRLLKERPTCSRVESAVIFFHSLKRLSLSLSYLLIVRHGSTILLSSLMFVVQSRLSKIRSLVQWLLSSSLIHFEIQRVEFWILSALVATYEWFSKAKFSHETLYNARSTRWVTTIFCTRGCCAIAQECPPCVSWQLFLQHVFSFTVHSLSLRRSMFGTATANLLDHVSRDWGDLLVVLLEVCWTLKISHFFHNNKKDHTNFSMGFAFKNFRLVQVLKEGLNFLTLSFRFVSCCSTVDRVLQEILWSTVFFQVSLELFDSLGHNLFLRLVLVDLVDRCANSLRVQPGVIFGVEHVLW